MTHSVNVHMYKELVEGSRSLYDLGQVWDGPTVLIIPRNMKEMREKENASEFFELEIMETKCWPPLFIWIFNLNDFCNKHARSISIQDSPEKCLIGLKDCMKS